MNQPTAQGVLEWTCARGHQAREYYPMLPVGWLEVGVVDSSDNGVTRYLATLCRDCVEEFYQWLKQPPI